MPKDRLQQYFVVQPYERNEDGFVFPMEPILARDAAHARRIAQGLNCAGAVAFSRAGDPDLGEYDDAEILLQIGTFPPATDEMAA